MALLTAATNAPCRTRRACAASIFPTWAAFACPALSSAGAIAASEAAATSLADVGWDLAFAAAPVTAPVTALKPGSAAGFGGCGGTGGLSSTAPVWPPAAAACAPVVPATAAPTAPGTAAVPVPGFAAGLAPDGFVVAPGLPGPVLPVFAPAT